VNFTSGAVNHQEIYVIRNFEEVRRQLADLVEIINGFKSEAVQLAIVEKLLDSHVLKSRVGLTDYTDDTPATDELAPKKNEASKLSVSATTRKSSRATGAKAPKAAIQALIAEGFFNTKQTAGMVKGHLGSKKAMPFGLGALQTALNRLVQSGTMKRDKHAETQQFEYWVG
jgi:hypothetical protein